MAGAGAAAVSMAGPAWGASASGMPGKRLNVLFIAVDDLRPQLGCYGDTMVKSPNIDLLAARGTVFTRAYCQQALCSPSRISLLSGRYPATTRVLSIGPALRETMPDIVTLPQHFKNNGYFTRSLGKVYHVGIDDPASWSVPSWQPKKPRRGPAGEAAVRKYRDEMKAAGKTIPAKGQGMAFYAGPAFEAPEVPDNELADGDIGSQAVAALRELARKPEQPFFLGVGFLNPHVPWVAPKKYWDLYNPQDIRLPGNQYAPKEAPNFAARSGDDFYWYGNVPGDRKITPEFGRQCLHGYLAAVSYVDAQVGRLLDVLAETGLEPNTLVILWGDHGYYMGEHGWWGGKHNNYEGATRAPLIVAVPGQKSRGAKCDALVEFVDIYPSLAEICRLPAPVGTEGQSFRPLLDDPQGSIKTSGCSWYPKGGYQGVALRTDRWRFVEWTKKGAPSVYELYDHRSDPQENQNLAGRREYAQTIKELAAMLHTKLARKP
ncbi:MAG: sulfatase [Planctomycetes bacterium]|nr:sulfatase [Planctomycetota bacterium]